MANYSLDAESGKYIFTGGTVNASGSVVNPPYNSSVYEIIQSYDRFTPDDPDEGKIYKEKIRNIYLNELIISSKTAEENHKRQKKFGSWIF